MVSGLSAKVIHLAIGIAFSRFKRTVGVPVPESQQLHVMVRQVAKQLPAPVTEMTGRRSARGRSARGRGARRRCTARFARPAIMVAATAIVIATIAIATTTIVVATKPEAACARSDALFQLRNAEALHGRVLK
jgi:hypothetical protein